MKPELKRSKYLASCDFCASQEDLHYCLLHTCAIKNMNTVKCDDWTSKVEQLSNSPYALNGQGQILENGSPMTALEVLSDLQDKAKLEWDLTSRILRPRHGRPEEIMSCKACKHYHYWQGGKRHYCRAQKNKIGTGLKPIKPTRDYVACGINKEE